MMDFFAKRFEGMCIFLAVLNYLLFATAGALGGFALGNVLYVEPAGLAILFGLLGLLLALIYNIFTFGLVAQFISMRNTLEKINNQLETCNHPTPQAPATPVAPTADPAASVTPPQESSTSDVEA